MTLIVSITNILHSVIDRKSLQKEYKVYTTVLEDNILSVCMKKLYLTLNLPEIVPVTIYITKLKKYKPSLANEE